MDIRGILTLIIAVLDILFGIRLKISKEEQFTSAKKYWWFFVVSGIFLLIFRLWMW